MSFSFKCPHCNSILDAEKEWIGLNIECPVCKNTLNVPEPVKLRIHTNDGQGKIVEVKSNNNAEPNNNDNRDELEKKVNKYYTSKVIIGFLKFVVGFFALLFLIGLFLHPSGQFFVIAVILSIIFIILCQEYRDYCDIISNFEGQIQAYDSIKETRRNKR